jgi:Tn3 transposase DDE domain
MILPAVRSREAKAKAIHGQSAVGFAFTHLLGFQLLPRLKNIGSSRLYPPDSDTSAYPALAPVLTRPIRWELIAQQYDQMVKYATALRLGTAEAEAILRRFTRPGPQHPTYAALVELGRAVKTAFLADYLTSAPLRREIHEGLQVDLHLAGDVGDRGRRQLPVAMGKAALQLEELQQQDEPEPRGPSLVADQPPVILDQRPGPHQVFGLPLTAHPSTTLRRLAATNKKCREGTEAELRMFRAA